MKIKPCIAAGIFLMLLPSVAPAQQSQSPRPKIPSMSNDDVGARPAVTGTEDPSVVPDTGSGAWQDVPAALASVRSFRARLLNGLPDPQSEILLEVALPDRFHAVIGGQVKVEVISVGPNHFIKAAGQAWAKAPGTESENVSFKTLVSHLFDDVKIAKLTGADTIDGIAMNVFDVTSVDRAGKVQKTRVWAGKSDSLPRKIQESREGRPAATILFYDFNADLSIQEPL